MLGALRDHPLPLHGAVRVGGGRRGRDPHRPDLPPDRRVPLRHPRPFADRARRRQQLAALQYAVQLGPFLGASRCGPRVAARQALASPGG